MTKAEQRRRYRKKYPEKIKDERRKYLDKKLRKEIKENPEVLEKIKGKLLSQFDKLTRLTFDDKLPKRCEDCGISVDLHIHHMQYVYPIELKHLIRLCRRCHVLEHQKLHPRKERDPFISTGNQK